MENPPERDDDVTRLSDSAKSGTSSSGWLSSSGAIDHGRFPPGTLLGGRYRIVGRLGRGGMGEVYRADDLKLGQPVALKFLPPDVDRDPARLTQLHTEVRMARQVSHPNVCRVYDIDEVEGHTFLSMEYVDGEDLASLLRRIGRFPQERGLEIARQICAGLASAHDRGVVHRDFKPANVMLDGAGKVRITDFGLAGAAGESIRAGTPAYMAPEQLAGGEVTARSDIYALGLVLYEIFTGQRALEGKNLAELIRKREQSGIAAPSAIVPDLDEGIEVAIMRCLRPNPDDRPASALAVAALLPGGDPLAAALAAGETPSPEMVAAAGGVDVLSRPAVLAGAVWIAVSIVALLVLYERVMFINRIPTPKTPEALQDRVIEALAKIGYGDRPLDTEWGLGLSLDYARYIDATSRDRDRWDRLNRQRPEAFALWYRTSPRPLVPFGDENRVLPQNPPLNVGGMTLVVVDASGRLAEFSAVPPPQSPGSPSPSLDWKPLFDAAGLTMTEFTPSTPQINPPAFAEQRAAWEGRLPDQPDHLFRVEAAAYGGKPVYFVIAGPWSRSGRAPLPSTPLFNVIMTNLGALIVPALMLTSAVLARRNLKLGRGDRRGALHAASAIFLTSIAAWMLSRSHVGVPGTDVQRLFGAIGRALFDGAVTWLTYLGIEPYVRRFAPDSLIGWTRLISGRWSDPRVAADVLVGISAGLAMTMLYAIHNILPPLFGRLEPVPLTMDANVLASTRSVIAYILSRFAAGFSGALLCVAGVVALRTLLKRTSVAAVAAAISFTPAVISGMWNPGTPILDTVLGVAIISVLIFVIIRFGVLATVAALTTHFILLRAPLTLQFSSWRGPAGLWFVGIVAAAGFAACYYARVRRAPE